VIPAASEAAYQSCFNLEEFEMRKSAFALALVLCTSLTALAQSPSVLDEIEKMKANNVMIQSQLNGISAVQTAMQADIANIKTDMGTIREKLAILAAAPSSPTVKQVWQPAVTGAWGQTVQPGRFVSVSVDASDPAPVAVVASPVAARSTMTSSYSMMSSSSACANGSCSAGAGRMGLFGRRR
jgi:hypothetical protein